MILGCIGCDFKYFQQAIMEELNNIVTTLSSDIHQNSDYSNNCNYNSTEMYSNKMSYSTQQPQPTMIYNNNCINSVSSQPTTLSNVHHQQQACAPISREWTVPPKNNVVSVPEYTLNSNNNSLNGIPSYHDPRLQTLSQRPDHQVNMN